MALPFFYSDTITTTATTFILNEETSKHVVQVLRMQNGQALQLTNGLGYLFEATITDNNRKHCRVKITAAQYIAAPNTAISIAISLLKNTHRFEWLVEKVTELGVQQILPIICDRTEKTSFKMDRINNIAISAMLQSQQTWLPIITMPQKVKQVIDTPDYTNKFIAHCEADITKNPLPKLLANINNNSNNNHIILIGPEGDFTVPEIEYAVQKKYQTVSLGNTRLRTETAGLAAAIMLTQFRL